MNSFYIHYRKIRENFVTENKRQNFLAYSTQLIPYSEKVCLHQYKANKTTSSEKVQYKFYYVLECVSWKENDG